MKHPIMYSDRLRFRDYRIAKCDELDLEAIVLSYGSDPKDYLIAILNEEKAALREIDSLKISKRYESERERLAAMVDPLPEWLERPLDRRKMDALQNFLDGLDRTPNLEQRKRFEDFYRSAGLGAMDVHEAIPLILPLERAEKPKGRPAISPPWRNCAKQIDTMRLTVASGMTIPDAARREAENDAEAGQENRAKYFEKLFRQRQRLRE